MYPEGQVTTPGTKLPAGQCLPVNSIVEYMNKIYVSIQCRK